MHSACLIHCKCTHIAYPTDHFCLSKAWLCAYIIMLFADPLCKLLTLNLLLWLFQKFNFKLQIQILWTVFFTRHASHIICKLCNWVKGYSWIAYFKTAADPIYVTEEVFWTFHTFTVTASEDKRNLEKEGLEVALTQDHSKVVRKMFSAGLVINIWYNFIFLNSQHKRKATIQHDSVI